MSIRRDELVPVAWAALSGRPFVLVAIFGFSLLMWIALAGLALVILNA